LLAVSLVGGEPNGTRILDLTGTTLTDTQIQLIVQSPRDL